MTLLGGTETQQEKGELSFFQHSIRHFTFYINRCAVSLICVWCMKPIKLTQKLYPAKGFKKTFCTVRPERMGKCRIYDSHPDRL